MLVIPRSGLGNKIRAIGAARRLAARSGINVTLVLEEPDTFLSMRDVNIIRAEPPAPAEDRVFHGARAGMAHATWSVHATASELSTCHVFDLVGAPNPVTHEAELGPYLPRPAAHIERRGRALIEGLARPILGIHLRGGKNHRALATAPIPEFAKRALAAAAAGWSIFVASDDESRMGELIAALQGTRIRLPAAGAEGATPFEVAYQEMFALACCDRVIGAGQSSFSRLAAIYNGSSACELVDTSGFKAKPPSRAFAL